jgi:hypothetical protein
LIDVLVTNNGAASPEQMEQMSQKQRAEGRGQRAEGRRQDKETEKG